MTSNEGATTYITNSLLGEEMTRESSGTSAESASSGFLRKRRSEGRVEPVLIRAHRSVHERESCRPTMDSPSNDSTVDSRSVTYMSLGVTGDWSGTF